MNDNGNLHPDIIRLARSLAVAVVLYNSAKFIQDPPQYPHDYAFYYRSRDSQGLQCSLRFTNSHSHFTRL
jgi:hypothetical protein